MEREKIIKKLLHTLEHTEEHFETIIQLLKDLNLDCKEYEELYNKLKEANEKIKKVVGG
ncbi:hypothetical protein J422_04685 [Methanocaldococcus villosus KIN24-T80]|uniref:Uncharacterized protein n=1 Tax=Methanocaldococcus villosus KIN24-T80 TaxID=1069083 RepID=N6V140_9EURY|nr:hypothetical protein [Methanocaldococcus villosus]ENN96008.1 hypothetical protein J422_04685 [Methanocaldococcus villosus KIN24-T80]